MVQARPTQLPEHISDQSLVACCDGDTGDFSLRRACPRRTPCVARLSPQARRYALVVCEVSGLFRRSCPAEKGEWRVYFHTRSENDYSEESTISDSVTYYLCVTFRSPYWRLKKHFWAFGKFHSMREKYRKFSLYALILFHFMSE